MTNRLSPANLVARSAAFARAMAWGLPPSLLPLRLHRRTGMRPAARPPLMPLLAILASLGSAVALFVLLIWPASAQNTAVTITGTPKFGQILTADTSAIVPEDYGGEMGSSLTFTYQWVRSKGGVDTDIPSTTSTTYTVTHDDFRHQIKVKVGFTVGSTEHMETSAAVGPVLGTLTQPSTPYTAPSDALWSATIDVESSGGFIGFHNVANSEFGSVSEKHVFLNREIQGILGSRGGFLLNFKGIPTEYPGWERWTFHVNGDVEIPLSEMSQVPAALGWFLGLQPGDYTEFWEEGSQHTVHITTPGTRATGAPSISGTLAVDQPLTVDTSAISDTDGLTNPTFFYQWFRTVEGEEVVISGAAAETATYTVGRYDEGRRLRVEVLFLDDDGNTEALSSTLTGVVPGPTTIETITVDTDPSVTRHADSVNYYANGNEIGFTVNFTEDISVTGSPELEFFIGNESKTADYDSGASTSRALKFQYTVQPGDQGRVSVRALPVKLSTGDAITSGDTPANLFFTGIVPQGQQVLGVPFITGLAFTSDAGGNQTYGRRDALDLTVTYNEAVTVSGGDNLTLELDLDGNPRTATYAEGAGTEELVFRYIISLGDVDANGPVVPANGMGQGGTIQGTGTGTPGADRKHSVLAAQRAHKVDASLPSVTPEETAYVAPDYALASARLTAGTPAALADSPGYWATSSHTAGSLDPTAILTRTVKAVAPAGSNGAFRFQLGGTSAPEGHQSWTLNVDDGLQLNFADGAASTPSEGWTMTWSDRDYSEIWNDGEAFTLYITVPEVTIAPLVTPVEEGASAEFTVSRAGTDTAGELSVAVNVSETGAMLTSVQTPQTVTIPDGQAGATFSLTTVDDGVEEPDSLVTATLQVGAGYILGSPSVATVTVQNDDGKRIELDPPALTVPENGSATYTVQLGTVPQAVGGSSAVTITVASSDTALSVSPTTLNFDPTNWNTGMTVTVRVGSDSNAIDETYTVTHTASGADYGSIARSIDVTVDDDDENRPASIRSGRSLSVSDAERPGDTVFAEFKRSAIADPDGLATNWPFEVQWVRVAADNTEINIPGARGPCTTTDIGGCLDYLLYDVRADDVGHRIGYRILFEDRLGNPETVRSDLTSTIVDPVRLISARLLSAPMTTPLSGGVALFVPGDKLRFEATVNRPVTVAGTPDLVFRVGSGTTSFFYHAPFVSLDATGTKLTFEGPAPNNKSGPVGIFQRTVGDPLVRVRSGEAITDREDANEHIDPSAWVGPGEFAHSIDSRPFIVEMSIASDPGADQTYGLGDIIRWATTWSIPVTVSGSPDLKVNIGQTTKDAPYADGTSTKTLVFEYEVLLGDADADGVSAAFADIAGGTLRSTASSSFTAHRGYGLRLPQAAHRVEASQDADVEGLIWNATLTVGESTGFKGYFRGPRANFGSLSDDALTDDATIFWVLAEPNGTFQIRGTPASSLPEEAPHWTLQVGDDLWPVVGNMSETSSEWRITWSGTTYHDDWGEGDEVELSLYLPLVSVEAVSQGGEVEEGDSASFRVTRRGSPDRAMPVRVSVSGEPAAIIQNPPTEVTIRAGQTTADFSVRTTEDRRPGDGGVITVSVLNSADDAADGTAYQANPDSPSASVTVTDDDPADIVLSKTSLAVVEGAAAQTYTVSLASEPAANVNITITGQAGSDLTVSPASLTFTTSDYTAGQTVAVTAGIDSNDVDERITLTHTASGSPDYAGTTADLPVSVTDNNTAITAVSIVSDPGDNDIYGPRDAIDIRVTFKNAVDVDGIPQLGLEVAGETRQADYFQGNGTSNLTFRYLVADDDDANGDGVDNDGVNIPANSITLNGGSITDNLNMVNALLDHDAVAASNSHKVNGTLTTVAPLETPVALPPGTLWSGTLTVGARNSGNTGYLKPDIVPVKYGQLETAGMLAEREVLSINSGASIADSSARGLNFIISGTTAPEGWQNWTLHIDDGLQLKFTDGTQGTNPVGWYTAWSGNYDELWNHGERFTVYVAVPAVSVAPVAGTVDEGSPAQFRLTRTGDTSSALAVTVTTAETGNTISGTAPTSLTIRSGQEEGILDVPTANDGVIEDDSTVTLTVVAGTGYVPGVPSSADVVVRSDDAVGITLSPASLTVDEQRSASYTVVLDAQPSNDVTVTITGHSGTDVSINPATPLAFTSSNWSTPRSVTVSAADDSDFANDEVTLLHTAAGATEYASVTASLKVTVDDDDAENSLPTGVPTISPTAVPEVGVTLTADPSGISDPDGPANPTFSYQWVRVSAANVETDISGATSATYEVQAADVGSTLKVKASFTDGRNKVETVESAPTAVVTVTQVTVNFGAAAYTAAEGGAAAAVQVTLDKAPNRILNIAIAATPGGGADTGDYSVSPTRALFGERDTVKEIIVTATNDDIDDDNETVTLTLGTPLPDGVSAGGTVSAVVTITDDDEAAVLLSMDTLTVSEGGTGTVQVSLATQPSDAVSVAIAGFDGTDVSLTGSATLNFTTSTWNSPQTVVLRAAQDTDDNAEDDLVTLTFTATGGGYSGLSASLAVTVDDDETPNSPATGFPVIQGTPEVGEQLTIDISTIADANGLPNASTFVYQWIQVASGGTETIITTATESTYTPTPDDVGASLKAQVSFTDNGGTEETLTGEPTADSVVVAQVTVAFAAPSYPVEEGETVTITVNLDKDPHRDAAIPLVTTPANGATTADYETPPGEVVFSAGETSKELTITAVDDDIDESGETLALAFGTLPEGVSQGATASSVVRFGDDDVRGITLMPDELTVTEGGSAGTYTVRLASQPTSGVTLTVAVEDPVIGSDVPVSVSPARLSFNASNWDGGQTIRVTALSDSDADNESTTINHTAAGGDYDGVAESLPVTVDDDETPNNPAEGEVIITGNLEVGESLTADTSGITDADGLTGVSYNYQWIREMGGTETEIPGADAFSYRLTDADAAHHILVRVSFTDDAGNAETLTSEPTLRVGVVPVAVSFGRSAYAVNEGETVTIEVRLDQDPERTVAIPLTTTHGGDATADDYTAPTEVVFSAGQTSQELTITANDDQMAETDETLTLTFGMLPEGVSVGATAEAVVRFGDDDSRGIMINPESLTLIEGGSSHSYTVQLLSQPTSAVTVRVDVEIPSGGSALRPPVTVNPATLRFNASNWNSAQTVRVSPNHDDDAFDASATLDHTASGGGYDNETASLRVTVTDDDAPVTPGTGRIELSETTLSIEEEARQKYYTVKLASEPVSRVTVRITGQEGTGLSVFPEEFEFVLSNWDREQRVGLNFGHDQDREDHTVRLTHTAYGREDYEGVTARLTVAVEDNDPHGTLPQLPQVSMDTESAGVTEGGDVVFTLTRTGDRTEALTVSVEVEETGGMIRGRRPSRITFEQGSGTAGLTVSTDDDSRDEASSVISATILDGRDYEAGRPAQAFVTVADNDSADSGTSDRGVPVIRGTPRVGEELLADMSRVYDADGFPDDGAFRFTWLLTLTDDVKEVTNSSGRYTPVVGDIGRTVAVRVSYNDNGGNAEERTSSATRTVAATTPGAPGVQPSYFYAEPGYREVTLSWSAPESDGGSEITRYQYRQRTASGRYGSWRNASYSEGQGYQSTVTGLNNGTEYRFQIRAVNSAGAGPESPEVYATPADGGICNRTAQVKGRILARLKLLDKYEGNCLGVEEDHLAKLTLLDIADTGITNIKPGDFAGLTKVTKLDLSFNSLTSLPDGVFEGLTALEELELANNQLRNIEAGAFEGLQKLKKLRLLKNELSSFPFDQLDQLPELTSLSISGNPGFRKGIQVSADRLEVTAGGSVEYRVRLLRPDAGSVSVTEDADGVSVSPGRLTFTKEDWFRSQIFTVTVGADAEAGQVVLTHTTSGLNPGSDPLPQVTVAIAANTDRAASDKADPPPPPKNLRTVRGKAAVELTWDAPGDATVIGYRIARRSSGGGRSEEQTLVEDTGSADNGYTDKSAKSGVEYEYRVSARTEDGLGEASEWVSAGPEPQPNNPSTGAPAMAGAAQVGETLKADTSGIADEDGLENVTFGYQWLADDTAIQGATNADYTLVEADEGKAIKVRVTFTDNVGNEETLTSAATAEVAAAPTPNNPATGAPTISGTAQVGEALTADTSGVADTDGLSNVQYEYQWLADDAAIAGATGFTYTPVAADEGKVIKVQVSFTDDEGNEESLTSAATAAVAAAEPSGPPAKPRGLSATATHDQVTLTWDDPSDDSVTGYVVLRRIRVNDVGGEFSVLVPDTGSAATTYTDGTVAASTTYTYRIKAVNGAGTSERSRWFHIDTPAAP